MVHKIDLEEGVTPEGRSIIGFTLPIAIGLLTTCVLALGWLVYSDRTDHQIFVATLQRHIDPLEGGHETRASMVNRIRTEERIEARNTDWNTWRGEHTKDSEEFFAEQRAFNMVINPSAASRAAASIIAPSGDDPE